MASSHKAPKRRTIGCSLLGIVAAIGLLAFVLVCLGMGLVSPLAGKGEVWDRAVAFGQLSCECKLDWSSMYVFAAIDAAGTGVRSLADKTADGWSADAVSEALAHARNRWDEFVSRGTKELNEGLRNVNPPCPLPEPGK